MGKQVLVVFIMPEKSIPLLNCKIMRQCKNDARRRGSLRLKVTLHWSTCNANLQRRFATHVFRTNLQTCYTFQSLSKISNALQHCKYRKKSSATGCCTRTIFRETSYHCKLALQVDQCNTTFTAIQSDFRSWSRPGIEGDMKKQSRHDGGLFYWCRCSLCFLVPF